MADQLQLRGGTTTEHATFIGALREVTVDTDKDTVVVHDNATAGGHPLLREDLSNLPAGTIDNADINANAAIAGTKISPNFGSQNVVTTGDAQVKDVVATGNVQAGSINGGPLAGFKNAVINGNFDIWQRGTSFTGFEYGADRWLNVRVGTACTMSRQAFTLGQTDVPGEPTYFCRMAVTSVAGAGNASNLTQRIEDVRTFAGRQVTVSFWAKADAAKPIAIEFAQGFGTGGSPSSQVSGIGVTKVTLSTSWAKYTVTVTLPSISGKTLGSDNNSTLIFRITFDAGSDFNAITDSLGQQSGTFDIAQVQVEAGPVATPFERRPIGTELALCQRYYYASTTNNTTRRRWAGSTAAAYLAHELTFPVTMRATPTIDTATPTFSNCSTLTAGMVTPNAVAWTVTSTIAGGVFSTSWATTTADAEL
jgi:hypothetical protein